MVCSIVIKDRYNIGMNSNRRIKVNDNILAVDKEVPFVRYRFENYGEAEYNYIADTMKKFSLSTHLVEIPLDSNAKSIIEYFQNNVKNIAIYVYIDITEEEVQAGALSDEKVELAGEIAQLRIDRVMLKDKSQSLDTVTLNRFVKTLSKKMESMKNEALPLNEKIYTADKFGVCSSPLSFNGSACLTAVKARELASIYGVVSDMALPSANHQCMNCCGCIRYTVVDSDTEAPSEGKVKGATKVNNKDNTDKKSKDNKHKTSKNTLVFGANSL